MTKRIVAIHQPQYLPYLGFFHKLYHADMFVALDDVQFQKNGLQNRNKIKHSQGWQWLTVPVLHNHGQLINQVRMNSQVRWQRKHWQALLVNYGQAPYFETLGPALGQLLEAEYDTLSDLNMALTAWAMKVLNYERPVHYSSTLSVENDGTERLVAICRALGADTYLSGPGGRRYLDLDAFAAAGIRVRWQEFQHPVYEQRFEHAGFIPNLSVVDVLFNCGSETRSLMEAS